MDPRDEIDVMSREMEKRRLLKRWCDTEFTMKEQRRKLRALVGMCKFHLSYF